MEKTLLAIYIGVAVYWLLSLVVDIICICSKSLNRLQVGAIGLLLNMLVMTVIAYMRDMDIFPNEEVICVMVVISIINMIASMVQIFLGMVVTSEHSE